VESALRRLLATPALGGVVLMERAGRTAGYALISLGFDLEYGGTDAYLVELWLEPWARGQRLSPLLLAEAERAARTLGAGALHLVVRPDNTPARALYRHAGFEVSPRLFLSKLLE
jgi:ribosomal protein S18 acetylase RimI-like enzyme